MTTMSLVEVFELPASLVGPEVERLRPSLLGAIRRTTSPVIALEASQVELISSSGLVLLVEAALLAREYGKAVEVRRPSELFSESIALTGLAGHLGLVRQPVGVG
jgi:anti-anti-sigma regulatory factor